MNHDIFGAQLRAARKADKMTQIQLAKAAGISRNYLSEIERGVATNIGHSIYESLDRVLQIRSREVKKSLGIQTDKERAIERLVTVLEQSSVSASQIDCLSSFVLEGDRHE